MLIVPSGAATGPRFSSVRTHHISRSPYRRSGRSPPGGGHSLLRPRPLFLRQANLKQKVSNHGDYRRHRGFPGLSVGAVLADDRPTAIWRNRAITIHGPCPVRALEGQFREALERGRFRWRRICVIAVGRRLIAIASPPSRHFSSLFRWPSFDGPGTPTPGVRAV